MKHIYIYNESANLIDNCYVTFVTNDWWNFPLTWSVIDMKSINFLALYAITNAVYLKSCW